MNWDREVEVEWENRITGQIKLADLLDMTVAELTREELEEFAEELSRFVDNSPSLLLHEG